MMSFWRSMAVVQVGQCLARCCVLAQAAQKHAEETERLLGTQLKRPAWQGQAGRRQWLS